MSSLGKGNWFYVMLVDIANADLGVDETPAAVRERLIAWTAQLGVAVRSRGGSVVRDMGSSLFCTFGDPDAATQAALILQRQAARDTAVGPAPALRVALHAGDLSPAVATNLVKETARMVCLCEPGRILVSDEVAKAQSPLMREMLQPVGGNPPDAAAFRVPLWELPWGENVQATATVLKEEYGPNVTVVAPPPAAVDAAAPVAPPPAAAAAGHRSHLALSLAGYTTAVHAEKPFLFLGREDGSDIRPKGDASSRYHARVEFREDGFYLIDDSRNGTFVYDAAGTGVHVHKAEYRLPESGLVCPGCPADHPAAEPIRFRFNG